jgi:uncharacterized protein
VQEISVNITKETRDKDLKLGKMLQKMGHVLIAFSGGVDSAFLAVRATKEPGVKVLAVMAASETFPEREFVAGQKLATEYNIELETITICDMENSGLVNNNPDRCYHCKTGLFSRLKEIATKRNIKYVLNGDNYDDRGDYRPGMKAASELGVYSPLLDCQLTKSEIRQLSKEMNLSTWQKPAMACLSSRIPYGNTITTEKIATIASAEGFLQDLGFSQLRVRYHDSIARIEVVPTEFPMLLEKRERIISHFRHLGFIHVTLDLSGYQTGSMNLTLSESEKTL